VRAVWGGKATAADSNSLVYKPVGGAEAHGTTLPHVHDPALEMIAVGIGEVRPLDRTIQDLAAIAAGRNQA